MGAQRGGFPARSLLARVHVARHSKDIDLTWESTDALSVAEAALRSAVERDLGDFFVFTIGPSRTLAELKGIRL
ncbi:hypothetical protein R8Z50_31915 [Longispora sp. K20-0274]|uniref:hypothetical protein n=1 Tax=Longispora sp. K20-0274 TaxID=3088255 RepID=UPI003999C2F8